MLIEADAARTIDLPVAVLGREVRVLASGVGDAAPVEARCTMHGVSVRPPAPVALAVEERADGGAVLRWVRRSRAGWRWIDGGDVPLGEEREAYRVTLADASGAVREIEVDGAALAIPVEDRRRGTITATVRQRGDFGESPPATITIAGEQR